MIKSPALLLASASPRRKELLSQAGIHCVVHPSHIDEVYLAGESAVDFAQRMSREKAQAAESTRPAETGDLPLLAADTIVVVDGQIVGKPVDRDDAKRMLELLSGRMHTVITGYTIRCPKTELITQSESTDVTFKQIGSAELDRYLEREHWSDKAGAYAVQEGAAKMVRRIEGSYTNVVGLPLCEVFEVLCANDRTFREFFHG